MARPRQRTPHPVIARTRELHQALYALDPLSGLSPHPLAAYSSELKEAGARLTEANDEWDRALIDFGDAVGAVSLAASELNTITDPQELADAYGELDAAGRDVEARADLAQRAATAARAAASRYRAVAARVGREDASARQAYVSAVVQELGPMVERYREGQQALSDSATDIRGLLLSMSTVLSASDAALASRVVKASEALPTRLVLSRLARGGDAVAPVLIESIASGESQYLAAHHAVVSVGADEQRLGAVSAAGFGE